MIVRMKKLSFLVFYKEYQEFLEKIRDLGVIHVIENQQGAINDAAVQDKMQKLARYASVMEALEKMVDKKSLPAADENIDFPSLLAQWDQYQLDKAATEARIQALSKDEQLLAPWGDFDPSSIELLEKQGYCINFFTCASRAFKLEWESEFNALSIANDKSKLYFITITKPEVELTIDAELCRLPKVSLAALREELSALQSALQALDRDIVAFAQQHLNDFQAAYDALQQDIDFSKVALSADAVADSKVMLLQGWAPEKSFPALSEYLDKNGYFYQVDDPTQEDDIPIQLSNNRFFRLFEPLTKLYMLPKYGELDLTMFFAPFFMLFFGLCLGDMGYGALIMLALPIFTKLFQLINPEFKSTLVFLFGLSTVLAGTLTGTAFGFSLYDIDLPFFQKMKDLLYQDNQAMFYLSLIIGCVQILFGMILKAVNLGIQLGFKYAISTIGWILLLVGVALAVLTGSTGSIWFIVVMAVAGCMVLFYNSPGKNIFLNFGLGLWDAYNMVTGLLGDVLSYVRLFALGLSGGILASVFNSLATGMSPDIPVVGFLVTALIFVIGHGLNIFMNILGSMVHPMRLTFVEFFKNSGYEGGGRAYKPFKK
ncbi:MAG: V-type ATP synthase subunit I [Bacteroidales bacterium]|nr:V-type ATP synthase subunit I [Bacteroidales bacterium]